MARWFLSLTVLGLAALSLLTVFKAPDWISWKFALLAGEYGYFLACLAAGLALLAGSTGRGCIAALALGAAALFLWPCVQAWRVGRDLPARLERAFGPGPDQAPAFSVAALFGHARRHGAPAMLTYPGVLPLDFYRSARPHSPLVVVIHGGGWDNGERGQIPELNGWLADRGYAVADISYRLAPAALWPAQRADVLAAVAALKSDASALGLDPTRIVLLGRSAGGQIAEATAYAVADPSLRGVVGLYAPADMNFAYAFGREDDVLKSPHLLRQYLGGAPAAAPAAYASASSIGLVTRASPPTLLVHGRLDTLVWHRQSERLARRLDAAGVPELFLSLPWATHAVEYHLNGPAGQLTTYALAWFLQAVTK